MPLSDQLNDYINAAFTGLWVQTHEPDEAEREILQQARNQQWRVAVWDVARGVRVPGAKVRRPTPEAAIHWPHFDRRRRWPIRTARPYYYCTTSTNS